MDETQKAVKAAMAQHAKIVVGDDKERQNRCMDEIKGILAKYDCVLVPRAILSPGNAEFMIECKSRPRGAPKGPHGMEGNPYAMPPQTQVGEEEEPPLAFEEEEQPEG